MARQTTRRGFIKTSSAAIAGGYFAAAGLSAQESNSANEEIRFACIGVGGKGSSDSGDARKAGKVVAICDIDDDTLEKGGLRFEGAAKYHDFREMLEKEGKNVDAVTVSTPDHTHAPAAAMALRMKKAVFTQKPLTHSIWEARRLAELAEENESATMMGNQGTANSGLRKAAALVQKGVIGKVTEVHVWTNRPVWPQGLDRPTDTTEAPKSIHWKDFIGPAEYREFAAGVYHPFKWRGWWAFGTGALGDMACHTFNMPFAALNLRDPVSVVAKTSGHNRETYPKWSVIDFDFPKLGERDGVKVTWYDGGKLPEESLFHGEQVSTSGSLLVGEKGSIYSPGDYGADFKILNGPEVPDVDFVQSPGHFNEWVRAIRGGDAAMSNFKNYAGPLTETILLGNLAVWADGKKIEWNAEKMEATNAPEVAHIIKPEYHNGYIL
ncbi:MAG: Gfo/Idh/MocA family oxidoreductase [Planctomycetales bacterium]|nr:Gfo/Idh/MocA family oxidoreductase [Planctomycetales bacterium]